MTFEDRSYRMMTKPRSEAPQNVNILARSLLLAHMLDVGYAASTTVVDR
jgi:hypothetical protein